jgi:hypothetical protein
MIKIIYEWMRGGKGIIQTFQGWNKNHGPIVYAKVGAKAFIILGTRQAAHDLLEKRAAIYSSREPSIFLDKYLHQQFASAFMPYGSKWSWAVIQFIEKRVHFIFRKCYQGCCV